MTGETNNPEDDLDPKKTAEAENEPVMDKDVVEERAGDDAEKPEEKNDKGQDKSEDKPDEKTHEELVEEEPKSKRKKKKKPKDEKNEEDNRTLGQKIVAEIPFLLKLAAFLIVFWTTIFGHYKIPSESMQPTLEVGDHLYAAKYAYGYSRHSLPLGLHHIPLPEGRIFSRLPKRGDVVVFRHPYQKIVMIKRVVGLPGDKIVMRNGRLYINDKQIERTEIDERSYHAYKDKSRLNVKVYEEQFDGEEEPHLIYERGDSYIVHKSRTSGQVRHEKLPHDNTDVLEVPENHVFFMGDNRDGSADSRAEVKEWDPENSGPGMVHMNYVIGRADLILFSRYRCQKPGEGVHCAKKRFFTPIR